MDKLTGLIAGYIEWLVEDPGDSFYLARIILFAIPVGGIAVISGLFLGMLMEGLAIMVAIPFISVGVFMFAKLASSAGGGLYHSGSKRMNHEAIVKGMYNLAGGYVRTGEFSRAREKYLEILETYPDELDAKYLLANLLDNHFGAYQEALQEFRGLRKVIREKKVDYQYKAALEKRIKELEEHLEKEGDTKGRR